MCGSVVNLEPYLNLSCDDVSEQVPTQVEEVGTKVAANLTTDQEKQSSTATQDAEVANSLSLDHITPPQIHVDPTETALPSCNDCGQLRQFSC